MWIPYGTFYRFAIYGKRLQAKSGENTREEFHLARRSHPTPADLFFAATGHFNEAFADLRETHALILSMRGVSLIDTAGLEAVYRLYERVSRQGGVLMFAGVHENARTMMERGGLLEHIGAENFFWSSDQAIVEAEQRGCAFCK